jgi:hypothetical protein
MIHFTLGVQHHYAPCQDCSDSHDTHKVPHCWQHKALHAVIQLLKKACTEETLVFPTRPDI